MADRKKNVSRSQMAEPKVREERKEQPVKAAAREERKEQPKQEKPARRESKGLSFDARIRRNSLGRFILEAYYELRHKVTWPTFEEARNMTIMVLALSLVVGLILGLADMGLYRLFSLISGGK
jgi:preprotein translocase subunit SecE